MKSLKELAALVQQMEEAASDEGAALIGRLARMDDSLATIAAAMKQSPARVVAEAVHELAQSLSEQEPPRIDNHVAASPVAVQNRIEVKPTPINFTPPAPVVHVAPPPWNSLTVRVGPTGADGTKTFTITRN